MRRCPGSSWQRENKEPEYTWRRRANGLLMEVAGTGSGIPSFSDILLPRQLPSSLPRKLNFHHVMLKLGPPQRISSNRPISSSAALGGRCLAVWNFSVEGSISLVSSSHQRLPTILDLDRPTPPWSEQSSAAVSRTQRDRGTGQRYHAGLRFLQLEPQCGAPRPRHAAPQGHEHGYDDRGVHIRRRCGGEY